MENKEHAMQSEPELTPKVPQEQPSEEVLVDESLPTAEELPADPIVTATEEMDATEPTFAEETPAEYETEALASELVTNEEENPTAEVIPTVEEEISDAPIFTTEEDVFSDELIIPESNDIPIAQILSALEYILEEEAASEDDPITQEAIWEDQPVDIPAVLEEIGPDEMIVAAAGLTRPEDLEFEKIMEETLQETSTDASESAEEEEEDFSLPDEFFLPVEKPLSDSDLLEKEPYYTEVDMTSILLQQQQEQMQEQAQDEEEADVQPEAEELMDEQLPPRKRRPKNTGTYGFFGIPHMITTVIWLALILFIGAGLGKMIWQVAADMLAFGRPNQTITITITSHDDLDAIAQKLQDTGLIEYPGIFKFYIKLANKENKIKPGTYELNTIFDYMALAKNMSSTATRVDTKVVIPEGYTCKQIFRLLEKNGVCTVESMEKAVMNADLSEYWFLEGIDQSDPYCLEGYLFPDTYRFYLDHDPESVLERLLDTFEIRFSEAMQEKLDVLNETLADMMRGHGLSESYIEQNLFTIREVVIVASMIEKETSGDEESYFISSVIYNRLTNPGEYPYLNIDAALVYITGNSPVTSEDLNLDTPYNTYLYKGLIPGPISNPGLASLNAALSPENTEYYYYALDPSTGAHKFFKTYKAHQNFLESLKNGG